MTRESGRFLIRAFGAAVFCLSLTAVAGSGTPLLVLSSDTDTATAGYWFAWVAFHPTTGLYLSEPAD